MFAGVWRAPARRVAAARGAFGVRPAWGGVGAFGDGRWREEGAAARPQRAQLSTSVAYTVRGEQCEPAPILGRMAVVAEVVVSKIFPAGFGWQGSSAVAEAAGLEDDQLGFFLMTGTGDFAGVLAGHCCFYGIKKVAFDDSISMSDTFQVGVWLASAAFMSGFAWQPAVNAFQAPGNAFGFNTAVALTTVVCGTVFYTGLRLGRNIYDPIMPALPSPNYENLRMDAQLSVAIGGATGCFVGTDTSYGDANWLTSLVGIGDDDAILTGMIKAGSSTSLGFTAVQSVLNVTVPHGRCWLD